MNTEHRLHLLKGLYHRPGFLLRRMHQISVGLVGERFRAERLTPPQLGVLYVLGECGVLDQSALARALGYDRVTTLRIVRGLQARGLVDKQASPDHGRKVNLSLTPAGDALLTACLPTSEAISDELLEPLAPADRTQFLALLEQLCAAHAAEARVPVQAPADCD